jgi:hypothetical protein
MEMVIRRNTEAIESRRNRRADDFGKGVYASDVAWTFIFPSE